MEVSKDPALKRAWAFLKHTLWETWLGTKRTYYDYLYWKNILKTKGFKTFEDKTPFELSEIYRLKKDSLKLIPFSFFIVVPAAELLIPPYILLFPNAFPS